MKLTTESVSVESIGLCEHCGTLLTIEGMSGDAVGATWFCPAAGCGKELTHLSFGYTETGKKVRWVSSQGKWISSKPRQDFTLGAWFVLCGRLSPVPY
jgi:hypothetical protein